MRQGAPYAAENAICGNKSHAAREPYLGGLNATRAWRLAMCREFSSRDCHVAGNVMQQEMPFGRERRALQRMPCSGS